jgi:hypothetical protein
VSPRDEDRNSNGNGLGRRDPGDDRSREGSIGRDGALDEVQLAHDAENLRIEDDPPLNGVAADVLDLAPLDPPRPRSVRVVVVKIDRVTIRT